MGPRVYASGNLICKAYRVTEFNGREFNENRYLPAELLEVSMDGMRIKTSIPLEEKNLLEFSRDYQVTHVALVRWVKRIENCYHAGLLCIRH